MDISFGGVFFYLLMVGTIGYLYIGMFQKEYTPIVFSAAFFIGLFIWPVHIFLIIKYDQFKRRTVPALAVWIGCGMASVSFFFPYLTLESLMFMFISLSTIWFLVTSGVMKIYGKMIYKNS